MGKKNIDVLLTSDVLKLGNMGDIVAVKAGYARNYLLPEGLAVPAGSAAKRQVEGLRARAQEVDAERGKQASTLKQRLDGTTVRVAARVAHDDMLFGSVGVRDIVDALAEKDIAVDPRQVHLHQSFKHLGRYEVTIALHRDVEATITLEVVNADPNAPSLDEVLEEAGVEGEEAETARSSE